MLEAPDGSIIYESSVVANFASDYAKPGQGLNLWPHEEASEDRVKASMESATHRLKMLEFDKIF